MLTQDFADNKFSIHLLLYQNKSLTMENPRSWTPTTRKIHEALANHRALQTKEPLRCGPSEAQAVYHALVEAKLIPQTPRAGDVYLQNLGMGYCGNAPYWWAKDGHGYTINLHEAEIMTPEQAKEIIDGSKGSHSWRAFDALDIYRHSITVADLQHGPTEFKL